MKAVITPPQLEALKVRLDDLSSAFSEDGYDDYSDSAKSALRAFLATDSNQWLIDCLFPSVRDAHGKVTVGFPRGGFDPTKQKITIKGFDKLLDVIYENLEPHTDDRWTYIDGINASKSTISSAICNIVGVCAKPVDYQFISISIDLDFFSAQILSPATTEFILNLRNAYKVRGDRNQITLLLRQSKKLTTLLKTDYATCSSIVIKNDNYADCGVVFGFGPKSTVPIFGAHDTFPGYQINFPDSDEIAVFNSTNFARFLELLSADGFDIIETDSSVGVDDVLAAPSSEISESLENIKALVKGVTTLHKRFNIPHQIEIRNLLPETCLDALKGDIRFIGPDRYVTTDPSDVYKISDGYRRNTIHWIMSDVAFVESFLVDIGVPFHSSNVEEIIIDIVRIMEPGTSDIEVSAFNKKTKDYKNTKTKKWSIEYMKWLYQAKYARQSTKPKEYIINLIESIIYQLSITLQQYMFADKIDDLGTQSQKLVAPTLEQALQLADAAEREDLGDFLTNIGDIFDIETIVSPTSLIDESSFEYAQFLTDLKEQHKFKASQDNWNLFSDRLSGHFQRYLSGQNGASYPVMMAGIASLTSYAGYIQVTADPLDSKMFASLEAKEGRIRYEGNSEGNLVLIMQLLTGDSGAGKSHIIRPLTNAVRVANVAINYVDSYTQNFFRQVHLDNGKLLQPKDFGSLPGVISGSEITPEEYKDIYTRIRAKDASSLVHIGETYTMSDHSAEIAALRDTMSDTELRLLIRSLAHNKLFSGTYNHPIVLYFDEASAFIESVYQHGAKITSFCELKAGESKLFRRAKSNISGAQIDIQFFGASMHGNIPLPKYLNIAYRADVKENRAEGVLGRIITGYITRNKNGVKPELADPVVPNRSDEEIISAITTIAHIIPNAMRRLEADYPGEPLSYFSSTRKVTNFYFSLDARDTLNTVHDRLEKKIEGMKTIYPNHSYAYDTYIGKLWEMIYTISGGHKLQDDLFRLAETVINNLTAILFVDGDEQKFTKWDICDYIKDRGMQSSQNNTNLLLAVIETLRLLKSKKALRPIRSRAIKTKSLMAAEAIIAHHYDVLLHSETMYTDMFGAAENMRDSARNAIATANATNNSDQYLAVRIVETLERNIFKCLRDKQNIRMSHVLRHILYDGVKRAKDPDHQRTVITTTFQNIMMQLVSKGVVKTEKSGNSWSITGTLGEIQPLLSEIKVMLLESI